MSEPDDDQLLGPDDQPIPLDDEAAEQDEASLRHLKWRIGRNLDRRVDQYLVDRVGYLSRAQVQRAIEEGFVRVNGKTTKSSYRPRLNDIVEIQAPPPKISQLVPEPIPLEIVYEDEHLLALNKQADLIIHPARGQWSGTLVNGLVHYGRQWSTINGDWRPGILHRLDRNTTGIMLVAKSDEAHWRLARQFETRTIQKQYVAIIHGVPELLADVIDMPIGKDRYIREKQAVRKIEAGGKPAVTRYEVVETLGADPAAAPADRFTLHRSEHPHDRHLPTPPGRFSFVRLYPKTGRTHQLRVHLSHLKHPIVGDSMYGGQVVQAGDFRFDRQALHAEQITFTHPISLDPMTLSAPLPQDMQSLLRLLRGE